ncbi:MAG: endonuclease/exonuclease/phosphatase family protein [Lentimicrobium sp.]|jgi:endonuclease/exonuclease/phosphatase family metal-dependent hydrolase|nr:endonuclease/exonuclease/phosphatase family protein [Lentimicrobium sp.]MDD2526807.1 endonuclease/exonuclease/phosphatase family protein [Lentimicrobiaceae bacterium]MDD4597894.1 endonuclease/exonuclease/phosphatase family protein [Lentimicrobiaceae bacterium]MDY0024420.1 endonuclease/exonuclease/phosphatase family protein [Lentimicrobium sp.]HAH58171.1 hypothetical protein [Bacteroidales bacterium]
MGDGIVMSAKSLKRPGFSFLSRLLLLLQGLILFVLLLGYLAAYIPPDRFWPLAFTGLVFPWIALLNILMLPLWLFVRPKFMFIPVLSTLLIWGRLGNFMQFNRQPAGIEKSDSNINLLSYNVRLFDLYNWKHGRISQLTDSIFQYINASQPDLLCIQEFHAGKHDDVVIADSIRKYSGLKHEYIIYTSFNGKVRPYGIATFSRWPIVNAGIIRFKDNVFNTCVYTDIVKNGDTLRLFNLHLESIQLSEEDYLFVTELRKRQEDSDFFSERSKKILRKLQGAFIRRASQARAVGEKITESPYPVIVCGDFNDTPSSYAYHQIAANLTDAYRKAGKGISETYAGNLMPYFRIDYLLYQDKYFTALNFDRLKKVWSDHYPIKSLLVFNPPAQK